MSTSRIASKNRIFARGQMDNNVDVQLVSILGKCVRYLADLNGSNWIKGDDLGAVDMRQRALNLKSAAFDAMEKAHADIGRLLVYGRCPGPEGDYSADEYFVALYDYDGIPARKEIAVPMVTVAAVFGDEVAEFIKDDAGSKMPSEYPANYRMATFIGRFTGEPESPSMYRRLSSLGAHLVELDAGNGAGHPQADMEDSSAPPAP